MLNKDVLVLNQNYEPVGVCNAKRAIVMIFLGKGEIVEGKPFHDKDGISDIMDSIRYPFQNLFSKGAKPVFGAAGAGTSDRQRKLVTEAKDLQEVAKNVNSDLMKQTIGHLAPSSPQKKKRGAKKRIIW